MGKGNKTGAAPSPVDPRAKATRKKGGQRTRLSTQMATVIEIMAYKGLPLSDAAKQAGITYVSARRAMSQQHVKNAFNQLVAEIRANAGQAAYLRLVDISINAKSETVRADANKWVAGVDGISPITKVQGTHAVTHKFEGYKYDRPDAVDVTPTDQTSGGHDDDSQ